jgi:serine/threonine protein kinase
MIAPCVEAELYFLSASQGWLLRSSARPLTPVKPTSGPSAASSSRCSPVSAHGERSIRCRSCSGYVPFPSSLSSLRSNKELTLGHPSSATPQIGSSGKPDFPPDITTDAEDFLNKTLELDHIKRPSAAECLSHPFIIQNLAPTL